MNPSFRRRFALTSFKLFDLACLVLTCVLGVMVSKQGGIANLVRESLWSKKIVVRDLAIILSLIGFWHLIFKFFKLYNSRRLSNVRDEVYDIIKATSMGTLVLLILSILYKVKIPHTDFFLFFWLTVTALTIIGRISIRYFLFFLRMGGRNLRNLVILGTNKRALKFCQKIKGNSFLGYRLLGFVDDDWEGIKEFRESRYPLLAGFKDFPGFVRNHIIDEVAICLPIKSSYDLINETIHLCEEQGIIVRFIPEIFDLRLTRFQASHFGEDLILTLSPVKMCGWQLFFKRLIDFSTSLILLLMLLPVGLVVAVMIKFSSPGPIFFIQERVGLNKRRFRVYKFRTMVQDAEKKQAGLEHLNEVDGAAFKIKNDPRITKVGKALRKLSLDELPQLINVLKGDMSLVGPRPLPVRDYHGFDQDWQRRRFSVMPGITCLWQVNGRSNVSFDDWMKMDMEYIDRWSLWLDFKILAQTLPAVLKGEGAT